MLQCNAVYYNGNSSRPNPVILELDPGTALLQFEAGSEKIVLNPNETELELNGNSAEIIYRGDSGRQIIKVSDADFIEALKKSRSSKGSFYQRLTSLTLKSYVLIAAALIFLITAAYLYVLPEVAEKAVAVIPISYDNQLGDSFYSSYIESVEIDSVKTGLLNEFTSQLRFNNELQLHFTVVNSETVNAFALPDGNIVIFTGLLDSLDNYEELAGLCFHEASHVNNRHAMKLMCRNLAGYLFISALLSDVNGVMAVIGDNVHTLQSLTYSRHFEKEADEGAFELLALNKINPDGLAQLFSHLDTEHENYIPGFLSTHPLTKERIRYIKERSGSSKLRFPESKELKILFSRIIQN